MSTTVKILCPLCDAPITAHVSITPGEPEVRYYPDGTGYPGSPASIKAVLEVEHSCECPEIASLEYRRVDYDSKVEDLIYEADFDFDPVDLFED